MDFVPKKVICSHVHKDFFPVLGLEMKDKNGKEYRDGDIVAVKFEIEGLLYSMKGFIRYFGGRFEIVCPWKLGKSFQRFIMGINPSHEIIGHIYTDDHLIGDQMAKEFKKEGGVKK